MPNCSAVLVLSISINHTSSLNSCSTQPATFTRYRTPVTSGGIRSNGGSRREASVRRARLNRRRSFAFQPAGVQIRPFHENRRPRRTKLVGVRGVTGPATSLRGNAQVPLEASVQPTRTPEAGGSSHAPTASRVPPFERIRRRNRGVHRDEQDSERVTIFSSNHRSSFLAPDNRLIESFPYPLLHVWSKFWAA